MGKWEYKLHALKYCESIRDLIDKEPNFEDLIRYRIDSTSISEVKENFEFYKVGWKLIGKDISNADAIYFKYLNKPESFPRTQKEIFEEIDSIVEGATKHPFNTNTIYEDLDTVIPEPEILKCEECNRVINSYGQTLCNFCSEKKRKIQEEKKFKPLSFNGFMYLIAGMVILYVLFKAGETIFMIGGAIGLFALLYILDNNK